VSGRLLGALATTVPMAEAFSDAAVLGSMLRFETALARVEARAGIIPDSAATSIARVAIDAFDPAAIAVDARESGTIAIPFVEALTSRVRTEAPDAAAFVHWGTTSQDLSDTALILCLVRAHQLLAADHARLASALRRLSNEHAGTIMLARTLLQPAPPTTFGLKAAGWLGAAARSGAAMSAAFREACVLQFGGASGTLAALGAEGVAVAGALARELELPMPEAPWHAHRDRLAALVATCGVYTSTLGKIARDVSLLMQFEVGEAAEPGGGSSSMPHKRNPAKCALILAAATRVPGLVAAFLAGAVQEHERGLGGWHAEAATIASVVQGTAAALAAAADLAETLRVDPARMQRNLDATGGMVLAERAMILLAPRLGREPAGRLIAAAVTAAARGDRRFGPALAAMPEAAAALGPEALASLDAPGTYLGAAEAFRRRLLGDERD
jgi:3-carboxy-cis,cis-muconate cycloisomerase